MVVSDQVVKTPAGRAKIGILYSLFSGRGRSRSRSRGGRRRRGGRSRVGVDVAVVGRR